MPISFNPLWKLLIDRGLTKKQLQQMTGLANGTMARLRKGDPVTTEVIERICTALDCRIEEVLEQKTSQHSPKETKEE